ncbi:MAG: septal ring lytic transglycosylase RlpA family protein [Candidatus Gorgyraea atricola]|nr:septal ring lytic transglycosylase RlpA family protein [Candidatus Gorgyraea atricola]
MKKLIIIALTLSLLSVFPGNAGSTHAIYKGTASWYSQTDPGILETTANMEIFDDSKLTCAMWDLPFNTLLKVTNLDNNKSIYVRVNDRGPAKRLVNRGRIIDLSKRAFSYLDDLGKGLIKVRVKIVKL